MVKKFVGANADLQPPENAKILGVSVCPWCHFAHGGNMSN
jgi:hypothetical protein